MYSVGKAIGQIGRDDGSTEEDREDNDEEHHVEYNTDERCHVLILATTRSTS